MSKGASHAPQLIKIDFSVLPAASFQEFSNRVHRKFTKWALLISDDFISLFLCSQKNMLEFRVDL
jgi:hypothetical protein